MMAARARGGLNYSQTRQDVIMIKKDVGIFRRPLRLLAGALKRRQRSQLTNGQEAVCFSARIRWLPLAWKVTCFSGK
jgi:hypothetical protein